MSQSKLDRDDLHEIWATDRATWRAWLEEYHDREPGVWLFYWKKASGKAVMDWSDAVDEALCFGWIDSTRKTVDAHSFKQYFAPRKPKSNWSKINKEKIERLTAEGRMAPAGFAAIELAKANGSWSNLDEVEAMVVPDDLIAAIDATAGARDYFDSLSRMKLWEILYWINGAKREVTRADRIRQIAEAAAQGKRPDRFRP